MRKAEHRDVDLAQFKGEETMSVDDAHTESELRTHNLAESANATDWEAQQHAVQRSRYGSWIWC